QFAIIQRPSLFDLTIHERRLQHAQGAQTRGVLAAHGIRDRRTYVVSQRHWDSRECYRGCCCCWLAGWPAGCGVGTTMPGTATPAGAVTVEVGGGGGGGSFRGCGAACGNVLNTGGRAACTGAAAAGRSSSSSLSSADSG